MKNMGDKNMNLYENDFFSLTSEDGKVYILVKEVGYEIRDFHEVLDENIRININNFLSLKRALSDTNEERSEIGILKPEIEIFISSDHMKCEIKVNLDQDYIDRHLEQTRDKIIELLKGNKISQGIDTHVLMGRIVSNEKFTLAEGSPSKEGESAKIKYFKRSNRKIEIKKDGNADYYNLNLIDSVKRGDWLGEKTPAVMGEEGYTIKGETLSASLGKDEVLLYDDKTIKASKEEGKIVLRALVDGAVSFQNNIIRIQRHLIIDGDVDFSVGNIDFDGHVTIKGTVKDGFSVIAVYDISILGEIGIGSTGKITSTRGNVFIKGGVNGKGITEIYGEQNVYVKYANEANITAGGEINIGYYAIDCELYGDKILINGMNGRLISGTCYAKSQVVAGVIGNITERETNINVHGFDRFELRKEYEDILIEYKQLLGSSEKIKTDLKRFEKNTDLESDKSKEYYKELGEYEEILQEISHLNRKRIKIQEILTSKGEGEVSVLTGMHPKTQLELKNMKKNIDEFTKGTFYVENSEIHFDDD